MEHISTRQLEKYQDILSRIDDEFKRQQLLKKDVDKENDKLIVARLNMQKNIHKDVFNVLLKIFGSIFDVFNVYGDVIPREEFESLRKQSGYKYYVVEVFVAKLLLRKLSLIESCSLNVSIRNSRTCINKTVAINNGQISTPIVVVVPFDNSIENAMVNATLFLHFDAVWSTLEVCTLEADISYHFVSQAAVRRSKDDAVVKIARVYNTVPNYYFKTPSTEYNFKCKCSTKHFFESIVKNCYHRLNPQIFSAFVETASDIVVAFTVDGARNVTIKLDKSQDVLSVVCNVHHLNRIKRYFVETIDFQREVFLNKEWLNVIDLKEYLRMERCRPDIDPNSLTKVYKKLRRFVSELPV